MSIVYGIDIGNYNSKISSIPLQNSIDKDKTSSTNCHLVSKFKYAIIVFIINRNLICFSEKSRYFGEQASKLVQFCFVHIIYIGI